MNIVSVHVPVDPWIDYPTEQLLVVMQLCAVVSHALLFVVPSFGVENGIGSENGSFISDLISINHFVFGQSVGWKVHKKIFYLLILFVHIVSIC